MTNVILNSKNNIKLLGELEVGDFFELEEQLYLFTGVNEDSIYCYSFSEKTTFKFTNMSCICNVIKQVELRYDR